MIRVLGVIETRHNHPGCVAAALEPDNLNLIRTVQIEGGVQALVDGARLRSIIATVDDYLMNLAIADDVCNAAMRQQKGQEVNSGSNWMKN
jgi:hypothetical protein